MKRLILSLVMVAACLALADDVTCEKYPDADSVLLSGLEDVEYRPDGTYTSIDEQTIKILTEKGRREESEIVLRYNARYGTAKILSVAKIDADGTEHEIDVSATTKEATDNSNASSNIYDPMDRRLSCLIPGVKVGDVVRVRTRRETLMSRVENQFADTFMLEWSFPMIRQEVRVTAPAELPLKRIAIRHPIGNVVHSEEKLADGRTRHIWTATDSPQVFPEPEMPPLYTQVQSLKVSTAEDWPTLSRWYWNLCVPHLEKTNEAMTNMVAELTGGARSRMDLDEKMDRLFKFVSQEIRYMGLTMEDTSPGYSPHNVDITFDNRYGVCRDKAALLVAMLRMAGLDAYPVLIHGGAKMDEEVPLPFFNHAIASVYLPGSRRANADGYVLMDPTDESSRDLLPAYLSDRSYLVARPEGERLLVSQVPSAKENACTIRSTGQLSESGTLFLSSTIEMTGINDNIYRGGLLLRKPEERRKAFERIVKAVAPGAELTSFDLQPANLQDTLSPFRVELSALIPDIVLKGETRDEITLPLLSRALGAANMLMDGNTALEKRRFPLDITSTAMIDETITVSFDSGVSGHFTLPETVNIEGPYEFRLAYDDSNGTLKAERRLAINTVEVSAEEYSDLRENIKRAEAAARKRPVLTRDGNAGANTHVRMNRSDYVLTSPYSWVVTNTVEKEILTYNGMKKNSELKFSYNPTWKKVEIISAVVSNRNGVVSRLGEKEINEFDCGWAAAAPRYPASKKLVANLPSVEVGSVISYVTVTTVTDSPAPFYATWYFDTFEPTDERIVTYQDWMGESWTRKENPKLLSTEQMLPDGTLWRNEKTISHGSFAATAEALRPLAKVSPLALPEGENIGKDVESIRNWMAKNVRIAGPDLYEVPVAAQVTDPAKVLAERYGTRIDYIRTLCALLKGAGHDADVVFATLDSKENGLVTERDLEQYPRVTMFSLALCRVREKTGGFWWWNNETTEMFVGAENEYTPLGATSYALSHYLDPTDGTIKTVPETEDYRTRSETKTTMSVRENGAVDIDFENTLYGASVGAFRKQYAEMLPEDRSRHYQELLGAVSQAASATSDLITDTAAYPGKMFFSCYVPDFATVTDGAITVAVPGLDAQFFGLTGTKRENPIGIGGEDESEVSVTIVFPEGYDVIEHLPSRFTFADPKLPDSVWYDFWTSTGKNDDGRLTITVTGVVYRHTDAMLPSEYFALLKDWSRISSMRANRTIVVRKSK